jgi:Tat protein secretion system quality control protein TatD with DNase activity
VEVAGKLAELRGLTPEEIGAQTSVNFSRFFSLSEKVNSI